MAGFNPGGPGVARLEVTLGGQSFLAAAIKFDVPALSEPDGATSSTDSPQPS